MRKRVKLLFMALVMPVVMQASGISFYTPIAFSHSIDGTYSNALEDIDYGESTKSKFGVAGLAYSTNFGKESMFGYSIAFESTKPETKRGRTFLRYDLLNTFEFGFVKKEMIRLWAGPRINIGYVKSDLGKRHGMEFGIAPAIGLNVNFGRYFAVVSSLDYKFAFQMGEEDWSANDDGTYTERVKGATFRMGVAYKFGEDF